jgi:Uma2 family endonuclease
MSIAVSVNREAETFADVLDRLGGISPDRIRMHPPPGTATVEDVVEIEERENRLFELIDGVLVEKIMGLREARLATAIATALDVFVSHEDLGVVAGSDAMFRLPDNIVRMPDVAYASWNRFPNGEIPDEAAPAIAPDLAVEVLSKGNTAGEMSRKLREYFRAGVRLVWFVNPRTRSVTVYTSPARSKTVPYSGTLEGGKALPGFKLPVADIFARLKRSNKVRHNGR